MTVFVGIFPPPQAIQHLSKVVSSLGLSRYSPPQRWHITVAFLGEPSETAASAALDGALLNSVGALQISGGGKFGEAIFWAGVGGDIDGLRKLNKTIRREMRAHRITPDDRYYRPHVTLAHLRSPVPPQALTAMAAYEGPAWPVKEIVLVRSVQGPNPQYHHLGTWPLDA